MKIACDICGPELSQAWGPQPGMNVQPLAGLRSNEDATSRVHDYESFHARRYVYLLAAARRVAPQAPRVLDVGPSPFTAMLEAAYPEVWTRGFHPRPPPPRHIDFNLNGGAHGAKIACERPTNCLYPATSAGLKRWISAMISFSSPV